MSSQSSTMFTVGTLLRHAADAGSPVRVLVEGHWVPGTPVGADGMGVVLDSDDGQVLVKLDQVSAVAFDRDHIDSGGQRSTGGAAAPGPPRPSEEDDEHPGRRRGPHVAGPGRADAVAPSGAGWETAPRVHEGHHVARKSIGPGLPDEPVAP